MLAGATTESKNEDKQPTREETKPEAAEPAKPQESAVSSPSSSSARPPAPTPSTSDKDEAKPNETSSTTSDEQPPTSTAAVTSDVSPYYDSLISSSFQPRSLPPSQQVEDVIDMEIFQQIIDLDDDDEDVEFAAGMVKAYFDQAEVTFTKMDKAFVEKNLGELSALGHFLKGSSAALGVQKVQASCEDIQHYGLRRDEDEKRDLTTDEALSKIKERISKAKKDHAVAEKWLKNWFEKNAVDVE